jgi:hypothetical protein
LLADLLDTVILTVSLLTSLPVLSYSYFWAFTFVPTLAAETLPPVVT